MTTTSNGSPAAKFASLLALLALCGVIGTTMSSATSKQATNDRKGFFLPLFRLFHRSYLFNDQIERDVNTAFKLSPREWQLFYLPGDVVTSCECTVTCSDPDSEVDIYMTFNARLKFDDDWDGWDCKQTSSSNTQTCQASPSVPDQLCWLAVRGDKIRRLREDCNILCEVDAAP